LFAFAKPATVRRKRTDKPNTVQPKGETWMKAFLTRFWREESGQDLIEYTLLLAFIALASASLFVSAGGSVSAIWVRGSDTLANAATAAS
jgi:Flp pilus assembly pilin Flp